MMHSLIEAVSCMQGQTGPGKGDAMSQIEMRKAEQ